MQGVLEIWGLWGKNAALAATRHILDDLYGPMCNDVTSIPRDEVDFLLRRF
jgi:hypothetical protein